MSSLEHQHQPLAEHDVELYDLIELERVRQRSCLELIASENFTSRAVLHCLGSCLTNKYAEGLPGARYYGGTDVVDRIERLAQARALAAFHLDAKDWGVNVQPYSGSPANFAVYTGLLRPHDRIMGLDLPSGGHLTHGFYTSSRGPHASRNHDNNVNNHVGSRQAVSATSVYFESLPYAVDVETGRIDLVALENLARVFKPALLICGGSAYPRDWDYAAFRAIADAHGAVLMCDMSHISGLVATSEHANPFEFCDVVTTTTHKSLRGPRAGMIFYKNQFGKQINNAVFPALQGGPHVHQIAAIATQLKEVQMPYFKEYIQQVKANAQTLASALMKRSYHLATDGTDNHLILWDLRPVGITGSKMEKLCDAVGITLNKNAVFGDRSALSPGGVRIGTPALTSRGFVESDFEIVADFLHQTVELAVQLQAEHGKKLVDFVASMTKSEPVAELKARVEAFALKFDMPGVPVDH